MLHSIMRGPPSTEWEITPAVNPVPHPNLDNKSILPPLKSHHLYDIP